MRGGRFHRAFCEGALSIAPASLHGRVRMLSAGYPSLVVPPDAILAEGTADALADVALQEARAPRSLGVAAGWDDVHGELQTFDDPRMRLASIDTLEDFHPGRPSLYRRVLVSVRRVGDDHTVTAWTYVAGDAAEG
jgi:gamma-glutamylcyclotransferase (GGCT)/AIG2-like uncharacterized protein YtfP